MLDIGKLIQGDELPIYVYSFSSMLDIGKLIQNAGIFVPSNGFSSMLDIGKLIHLGFCVISAPVLAQCWI